MLINNVSKDKFLNKFVVKFKKYMVIQNPKTPTLVHPVYLRCLTFPIISVTAPCQSNPPIK